MFSLVDIDDGPPGAVARLNMPSVTRTLPGLVLLALSCKTLPPPPPAPVAAATARFSNPAAVKRPGFPAKVCAVEAGAGTGAVNAAIAACNAGGGGTVTFAPGTYLVGSIHMLSNVRLQLDAGVTLKSNGEIDAGEPYGSTVSCEDDGHRRWHNALIWGEGVSNVAIVGAGTLDGEGLDRNAQKLIAFKSSRVMEFEGLRQIHTGHFAFLLTDCHDVTMANLDIRPSRDGVDLMECTNVNAHHLTITGGGDDAFAIKSDCTMGKPLVTQNITISDSTLGSGCNALQIGSETWGDFRDISWSSIKVVRGGKSGIGIQTNDGAILQNISYDDISMTGTSFPIFVNVTSLLRGPTKTPGHAENIRFRNVTATELVAGNNRSAENTAIIISGQPGSPHRKIVLENVDITFPGGGSNRDEPPEGGTLTSRSAYNPRFLTPVPAYGAYVRHARGVEFRNVKLRFASAEQRPAVLARDVDGLVFEALAAAKPAGSVLELRAVKNLVIKGSGPIPEVAVPAVEQAAY
jgi:polygalacturonase